MSDMMARMAEATRMTRDGRLGEATALIQRLLAGDAPTPQPAEERVRIDPPAATPERPRAKLRETLRRLAERARAVDVGTPSAPVPEGARFEARSFRCPQGARDFKLYVPAKLDEGPRPLVLMLHGCTQNPDDFALGTGMNAAAEEHGCLVAYPGQPASANQNRCWNWFRPEDQRRDLGEPAVLAGLVRRLVADEGVDPGRVFVAGMSAGGAAAATLAAEYPDLFAAVGVHSGLPHGAAQDLPSALNAMRQGAAGKDRAARNMPAIVFHGDADHVVSPRNGAAVVAQATPKGLKVEVERGEAGGRGYSRALHRDAAGAVLCEHWTIHGAGHAWTGGDATGSHTDRLGPDASREMLRFFLSRGR
jgi:poly(hydroxyalkanoate) depolymerase family esterase